MNERNSRALWLTDFPLRLPVLLAIALFAATLFHGSRGLYESTEGRYAECGREMGQAGTWLVPMLNGHPHWTKPPVTYLAIALPYRVLGATTWAARLYLIPCYLLSIIAVWWLAFRLWDDRLSARMSALVYATAAIPMIASQVVSTDYPLTAALALAQACFWEVMRKRSVAATHLLWVLLGTAFLVKGPPALLAVPAMVITWARLPQQKRRFIPLLAPSAIALFLIVGVSWYAWEAWTHPGLTGYWIHDEVVNRSLSDKFNRNPEFYKNFVIYLPVLLFGTLPWGAWLAFRWRAIRDHMIQSGGIKCAWFRRSDETFWLVLSTALPLAVFMLSRSKLPLYILPLFVPIAAGTGRLLLAIDGRAPWFCKIARRVACLMFALFIIGKGLTACVENERDMAYLHRLLTGPGGVQDPTRLAIFGKKHLNGLSFYYDHTVPLVNLDDLPKLLDDGGDHFVVYRRGHQEADIDQLLKKYVTDKRALSQRWRLVHVMGPAEFYPLTHE